MFNPIPDYCAKISPPSVNAIFLENAQFKTILNFENPDIYIAPPEPSAKLFWKVEV